MNKNNIYFRSLVPPRKDWNEDVSISAQEEGEVECQTVCMN